MSHVINRFIGKYAFLSNFYHAPFIYHGLRCDTAEHAFQSAKASTYSDRVFIANQLTAKLAKRRGNEIKLRDDWEKIKVRIMLEVIQCKFSQNAEITRKLMETRTYRLEEGNNWNDTFWGNCNGVGYNVLGRILMTVRSTFLRAELYGLYDRESGAYG